MLGELNRPAQGPEKTNSNEWLLPGTRFLTVRDVADYLRISVQSVYRWSSEGRLKGIKFGGCLRFPVEEVMAFSKNGFRKRRKNGKGDNLGGERS